MLSWVADGPLSDEDAETFLAQNVAEPLDAEAHAVALDGLRRTSPAAWRAWLETGSTVDASAEAGLLDLPALVLAGEDDADLGAAAQPGLLASVYPRARFVALPDTGHLIPLERDAEAAEAIARFVDEEVRVGPSSPMTGPASSPVIASMTEYAASWPAGHCPTTAATRPRCSTWRS